MEEHSLPGDISLRSIEVRVNDGSSLESSFTSVTNLNSCALRTLNSTQVHVEEQISPSLVSGDISHITSKEVLNVANEFEEKLLFGCKDSSASHLNGCSTSLFSDSKRVDCVDFTVNGLTKCYNKYNTSEDSQRTALSVGLKCKRDDPHISWSDKSSNSDGEGKVLTVDQDSLCGVHSKTNNSELSKAKDNINLNDEADEIYSKDFISCSNSLATTKTASSSIYSIPTSETSDISYVGYESENQMPDIMWLIQKDLSEPYSIYTYRYFIHNWPKLCFLALHAEKYVGAIVCKLDVHKKHSRRGYIAMLAVDENYRKRRIGSNLVLKAIQAMVADNADEVVLETEITNKPALRLYENLGFVRDKRLFRYYLNGVDALRLKLWLK